MTFCGTVAWMAPEVIKNEPYSEKVDIWSYGVVLWELLTQDVPFKDIDGGAILWGVGSRVLRLPIPDTAPAGLRLLINQCFSIKQRNRPSFSHILRHLEITRAELEPYTIAEWTDLRTKWRAEVGMCLDLMKRQGRQHQSDVESGASDGESADVKRKKAEDELIMRRREEWRHAQDVRALLEKKLRRVDEMYIDLNEGLLELGQKER